MAAISTVFLTLLKPGDHVVGSTSVYGPTRMLLEEQLKKFDLRSTWIHTEDTELVRASVRPESRGATAWSF